MEEIKYKLMQIYKVFRTTLMMENDIKLLKKINNLIFKYNNTNKEKYKQEIINIVKTITNLTNNEKEVLNIVRNNILNKENFETFNLIFNQ